MFCNVAAKRLLAFTCQRRQGEEARIDHAPKRTSIDKRDYEVVLDDSMNKVNVLHEDSESVLAYLNESWGVNISEFSLDMNEPLSRDGFGHMPDAVLVMQGWNKALAYKTMFAEAIVGRWRMLSAVHEIRSLKKRRMPRRMSSTAKRRRSLVLHGTEMDRIASRSNLELNIQTNIPLSTLALQRIERNIDPIGVAFGARTRDLDTLVICLLDCAVRELCPHSQIVQREAYRPIHGSADLDPSISGLFFHKNECKNLEQYCAFFATFGVHPNYWKSFCEAFVWAMQTHCPYSQEEDNDDLDLATADSIYARFVAGCVALPMIEANLRQVSYVRRGKFEELRARCSEEFFKSNFRMIEAKSKNAFEEVLDQNPSIDAYFSLSDRESMGLELIEMMLSIVDYSEEMADPKSEGREYLRKQGRKWKERHIPIEAFALFGQKIIEVMKPMLSTHGKADIILEKALSFLYKEAMQIVLYPLVYDRKMREEAGLFYEKLADELSWPAHILEKRRFEVNVEISSTGRYRHTSEELEIGARLAWRNSAKCIGRIAWNTLKVRDCRHCMGPREIFNEVKEHLKLATGGTNIQSVMTIFMPQHSEEIWGLRFWSSQFVRYAGYSLDSGEILGDPANADFTSYLISNNLWEPPKERSAFDVLPLVLKMPSNDIPFVYELPEECIHEINIAHPKFRKVRNLGYKWAAVPAISNFMMNLGGIKYPCAPFNGWFVSIEIARNLIERYKVTTPLAEAMNMDVKDKFLAQKVSAELETAICYSFEKQGFTIVDPMTVGDSFMTHCKRERSAGRECPAQWSWIGGLVGPTNPTWHLEMRDFLALPQYDYCCYPWQIIDFEDPDIRHGSQLDMKHIISDQSAVRVSLPKVLIGYGSETGHSESTAASLARQLKACKPTIISLNDIASYNTLFSEKFNYFFIICSTFGNGEPPNNAAAFFQVICKYRLKSDLNFAVLALGSSLYPNFCKAGRDIDDRMSETGATSLVDITCVDQVKGDHVPITKWLKLVEKLVLPSSLLAQLRVDADFYEDGNFEEEPTYHIEWIDEEDDEIDFSLHTMGLEKDTMRCVRNTELFRGDSTSKRSTRHLVFEIPKGASYETGDHVSVKPINTFSMALRFCDCFSHELEKAVSQPVDSNLKSSFSSDEDGYGTHSTKSISTPTHSTTDDTPAFITRQMRRHFHIRCDVNGQRSTHHADHLMNKSLSDVLQMNVDMSTEKKSYVKDLFLMLLSRVKELQKPKVEEAPGAQYFIRMVEEAIEHKNTTDTDTKLDRLIIKYPTVVHLLEDFRELFCVPIEGNHDPLITIADILVLMPRLRCRYYSISSAANTSPSEISMTVGVVNVVNNCNILVQGVCSNYLAGVQEGDIIKASIVQSSFRAPPNESHPVIMIGTGTGLAPFMGFIGDRSAAMKMSSSAGKKRFGQWHLYFGCRNDDESLYNDRLREFESNQVLSLHLAQSRQKGKRRKYVQDLLKENGKEVTMSLLSSDLTYFYICGDVTIARECSEACIDILREHGGMSRLAAVHHITTMKMNGRWQLDVWGEGEAFIDNSYHISDTGLEKMQKASHKVWYDLFLQ